MRASLLALAAVAVLALAAAPAQACTVEPPTVCPVELDLAAACYQGPCPPATNGGVEVRVLDRAVRVPLP